MNKIISKIKYVLLFVLCLLIFVASFEILDQFGKEIELSERAQENVKEDTQKREALELSGNNWMGQLSGNLRLSEINIPGTHDSTTKYVDMSYFSKTQTTSIKEQLEMGYRYLDIRLEDDNGRLKLVHGIVSCRNGLTFFSGIMYLDKVLEQCYEFLKENPTETIIFVVKMDNGNQTDRAFQKEFMKYVSENKDSWYLKSTTPCLGDVRGKMVLCRRFANGADLAKSACGMDFRWSEQNNSKDEGYTYEKNVKIDGALYVQDHYCYNEDNKWNAVMDSMENMSALRDRKKEYFLCFLSTKGEKPYGHPITYARKLNVQFMETKLTKDLDCGWLIADYATKEIAEHVYLTNFAD